MRPISGLSSYAARSRSSDALTALLRALAGSGPPGSPNLSPSVRARLELSLHLNPVPELDFDVAILGGGMGGYPAAIRASQLGLKVALVEGGKLGGTCLHIGCIPTKALLESSELYHRVAARGAEFGLKAEVVGYDYPAIAARRDAVVGQLYKGVQYLMKKNKIEVVQARGRIRDRNTIEADGKLVKRKTSSSPPARPSRRFRGSRSMASTSSRPTTPSSPRACPSPSASSAQARWASSSPPFTTSWASR